MAADADDIKDALADSAAAGIASATVDGQTVVAKSVDEQIRAARFVGAQAAASRPQFGLRFSQIIPPGAG